MDPLDNLKISDSQGNSWILRISPREEPSRTLKNLAHSIPVPPPGFVDQGSKGQSLQESSFFQSSYWGRVKSRFGWQAFEFVLTVRGPGPLSQPGSHQPRSNEPDTSWESLVLVLVRTLVPGISLAYIPHGPDVPFLSNRFIETNQSPLLGQYLQILGNQLRYYLPKSVLALRFDPGWGRSIPKETYENHQTDAGLWNLHPLTKGKFHVQPPITGMIDVTPDLEEILASFKSKHRYNIRLAEKKGVEIRTFKSTDQEFDHELTQWYGLYEETAQRDGILIHSLAYYRQVAQNFPHGQNSEQNRSMVLFQAYHQGDYLAGILVIYWNHRATYVYGASSNMKRNLMPAYALQWAAIREAKLLGCKDYDLFGMPGSPDPNHPMAGLYQFKAGFIQHLVIYPGTWDFVTRPLIYRLSRVGESVRSGLVQLKKNLQRPLGHRS